MSFKSLAAGFYGLYLVTLLMLMCVDRDSMPGKGWALARYLGVRNGDVPNVGMFFILAAAGGLLLWIAGRVESQK